MTRVIQQCLARAQTSRRCGEEPSRLANQAGRDQSAPIAMDGTTMRGTLGHEPAHQPSVHLLSLSEVQTGTVLAQRAVATKENEISAAAVVVTPEQLKGRISSADAMHTQKKWCQQVTRAQGDYLLIAKHNQATLREDLALFLQDPEADRGHWGIENRLHWRRDVTLGEDHAQVRSGCAPQVLAALHNTLLALLDFLHAPHVPNQMRFYQAHPLEALRLLLVQL